MTKIVVAGVSGRMGKEIVQMAVGDPELQVVAGYVEAGNPSVDQLIPSTNLKITSNAVSAVILGDVVIDFTVASAVAQNVQTALLAKKPIVIGTTGLSGTDMANIGKAAMIIPIVQASNMSLGMNILFKISQLVAKHLMPQQIQIIEKHHIHKKDAPSGSAITLKEYILHPDSKWVGNVPIQSLREGEIVGEHTVIERGWEEQIELTHRAHSRAPFAAGALVAAKWLVNQKPGLYSMQDVLGLK